MFGGLPVFFEGGGGAGVEALAGTGKRPGVGFKGGHAHGAGFDAAAAGLGLDKRGVAPASFLAAFCRTVGWLPLTPSTKSPPFSCVRSGAVSFWQCSGSAVTTQPTRCTASERRSFCADAQFVAFVRSGDQGHGGAVLVLDKTDDEAEVLAGRFCHPGPARRADVRPGPAASG